MRAKAIPIQQLSEEIRACRLCHPHLPLGPNPVVRLSATAKLLIVGQAPGTKVHASGVPWDDASGERLRAWLDIKEDVFYNVSRVAIAPIGFCYPGKGKSGDLPPRLECAPLWHPQLMAAMPQLELILLVGQYAQNHYLQDKLSLTQRLQNWRAYLPRYRLLPHPSPRNNIWLKRHPWFEQEQVPALQKAVRDLL